jgi:hypothetical protein
VSTKIVINPPRAPAVMNGDDSPRTRSYPSRAEAIEREQLLDSLAHMRSVVPVFARELVSARRRAAWLRAENDWLIEQVRRLQRGPADHDPSVSLPTS